MGMMGSSIRITEVLGALLSALIFCGFTAAYVGVYNTDLIEKKRHTLDSVCCDIEFSGP